MTAFAVHTEGAEPAHRELDTPNPEPGEVRIRVIAASVNGFDIAAGTGYSHTIGNIVVLIG